jgi:hypothetical protein
MSNEYWASVPIDKIANEILGKYDDYKTWLRTSGFAHRIRTAYETYYGFNKMGVTRIERTSLLSSLEQKTAILRVLWKPILLVGLSNTMAMKRK